MEDVSYPPEGECDEIILQDERYYLCKKIEMGFDINAEYYDFNSHGNDVFSYKYSSYFGEVHF